MGLAVLAIAMVSACGSRKPPLKPADDLYSEAKELHEQEYYESAIENYKLLLDNYPLDPRAEEIELQIAQAHYANEAYPEAIAAFSDFQRMHPTSPRLAEVEYSIGQAYSDQMTTIDRDLAAATNASQRYESVIARYPRSEYAEKSQKKLTEARAHLAERELYVASFYYRKDKPRAARGRMIELLSRYPETPAAKDGLAQVAADAKSADDQALSALVEAALAEHPDESGGEGTSAGRPGNPRNWPATTSVAQALRDRQAAPDLTAASASKTTATSTP